MAAALPRWAMPAAAIVTGQADIVVVYRALAQGQFQRFGRAAGGGTVAGDNALINPYGIFVPAQRYALKFMRYMHEHGIRREAMRAHRHGILSSCAVESARGDVRPSADRGDV